MHVRSVTARLGARVLIASRGIDQLYSWFDRLRSELVAALASEEMLDRYNEIAYGGTPRYQPRSGAFRTDLLPFEEAAFTEFFPKPPARILIGGAGGGREALALARHGYRIVAFDPAEQLLHEIGSRAGDLPIEARVGKYEQLDELFPRGTEPFDAAIFGWTSFSHLRTELARIEALRQYARLTDGPILISFLAVKNEPTARLARLRRALPRRAGRDTSDVFARTVGFYHPVAEDEVRDLAHRAGLRVVMLNFDARETNWPHAVLTRS